jgi:steroid 5-alpha reductase family enzyme
MVAESLAEHGTLLAGFVADLAATAVVIAAAIALNNTSVYDPYWSVAPILLAVWWTVQNPEIGGDAIVVVAVVAIWGIRLTGNFLAGWHGLNDEDWRYTEYRRFGPVGYWAISATGLQLVPTLVVFAGLLPVHEAVTGDGFGAIGVFAAAVALAAVWIESTADLQKRRFAATAASGALLDTGLWSLLRHPNYLGEVLFWWGLFGFGIAAGEAWTGIGAITITALFVFISIPLMDRRMLERRRGYQAHLAAIPALIPSFRSLPRWFSRATWRT